MSDFPIEGTGGAAQGLPPGGMVRRSQDTRGMSQSIVRQVARDMAKVEERVLADARRIKRARQK